MELGRKYVSCWSREETSFLVGGRDLRSFGLGVLIAWVKDVIKEAQPRTNQQDNFFSSFEGDFYLATWIGTCAGKSLSIISLLDILKVDAAREPM